MLPIAFAATPMKPIVECMDWKSQHVKLNQRFAKGMVEITIPTADGMQKMACLALRKIAGWLQTIGPNKVKPEIRDNIIRYQEECDDMLYEYWTQGVVVNPRNVKVMGDLNQACADFKRDKGIASLFGTGINEWKSVKSAHVSKIKALVDEANGLIKFRLADTGERKLTRT
ncbi:phage antirepressor N-terminal domain-containing protein [Kosakonia sp. S42]|uniref:phage antirepressor N-terminal domain-containing protein n=1 Tax=Kosakonia sp. S42 TaxID=2767458 RepID=UPI00190B4FB9|nr:phage antirepressor N-terminal domain-containing protein [Kosakonia sp. S42]MBK0019431.1 hypothetical protein [Kosakonia sp. S42]